MGLASAIFRQAAMDEKGYNELKRAQGSLLKKRLSDRALRELARSCGQLPVRVEDRCGFAQSLLEHMVLRFADTGDRDSLVTVLSLRCPERFGVGAYLEDYLAFVEAKKTLDRPILVLGEAYARSTVPETRRDLAKIVRTRLLDDAHPGARARRPGRQWVCQHRDGLVPGTRGRVGPEFGLCPKQFQSPSPRRSVPLVSLGEAVGYFDTISIQDVPGYTRQAGSFNIPQVEWDVFNLRTGGSSTP